MTNPPPQNPARTIRVIHLALVTGPVLLLGVTAYLRTYGTEPLPSLAPIAGFILAVVGVLSIALATAVLRPRISPRAAGETADAYWTAARNAQALTLWAVLEGAALLNVIGFFTTGQWSSVAVFFLAVIMMILFRPGVLDRS